MVCDTPYLQNEFGDPRFFYVFNLILSFSTCSQSFNKICVWEVLGANVLKRSNYSMKNETWKYAKFFISNNYLNKTETECIMKVTAFWWIWQIKYGGTWGSCWFVRQHLHMRKGGSHVLRSQILLLSFSKCHMPRFAERLHKSKKKTIKLLALCLSPRFLVAFALIIAAFPLS